MRALAFDLGGSSGKIFLGQIQGNRLLLEPVHSFSNTIVPFGEGLYWDFFRIRREMDAGIQKAWSMGPVDSFGIDSFNNDFSMLSARGELLLPVRCYRDSRTQVYAGQIYQIIPPRTLYNYTGNQLAPFNTFMQLAAMALAGQGSIFDAAQTLLFLPDLLGFSITGERVAEYTVAAESQFLSPGSGKWLPQVLAPFEIPAHILPPVVQPGTCISQSTKAYCRVQGCKPFDFVSVCEHDTASAFLGARCV